MTKLTDRKVIPFINKVLRRVRFAGLDFAPWLDLGRVTFRGTGIQWKHERYLTSHSLPPIYRVRVCRVVFSVLRNGTAYQRAQSGFTPAT